MRTAVYKFRLRPPHEGMDLTRQELKNAHSYRETLRDIENNRRQALRVLILLHGGEAMATLENDCRMAAEKESEAYAQAKATGLEVDAQTHASCSALRKELFATLFADRTRIERSKPFQAIKREIKARHSEMLKRAYETKPCGWGTAALVLRSHEQACEMRFALYAKDGLTPLDIFVPRFDGTGGIRAQIQGGASPLELFTDNRYAQIQRLPGEQIQTCLLDRVIKNGPNCGKTIREVCVSHPNMRFANKSPTSAESQQAGDVRMFRLRIGSDDHRGPVWASWACNYDRPLPPGAQVKQAAVYVRRIADREVWSVSLSLDLQEEEPTCGTGRLVLDIGWRQVPTGIRVAVGHGDGGTEREYILPQVIIDTIRRADQLQAIKDETINLVKAQVRALRANEEIAKPEWFLDETEFVHAWRSPSKLVRLVRLWKENRFPGDEALFDSYEWWGGGKTPGPYYRAGLEGWQRQDLHLWRMIEGSSARALRRRKDLYRNWASQAAQQFGTVVFEDFDVSVVAKRYPADNMDVPSSNRTVASVSEFVESFRNAFRSRGGCGQGLVDATDSTHECYACGHVDKFDAAAKVIHACSACKAVWDQDFNASRVLFSRESWCDALSTKRIRVKSPTCVCHQNRESHWAKMRRLKSEKQAKEAALEPEANPE